MSSADDWGVQSPSQQSIEVPLPFSEGDDVFCAWFFIHLVIPNLKSYNAGRDP